MKPMTTVDRMSKLRVAINGESGNPAIQKSFIRRK